MAVMFSLSIFPMDKGGSASCIRELLASNATASSHLKNRRPTDLAFYTKRKQAAGTTDDRHGRPACGIRKFHGVGNKQA